MSSLHYPSQVPHISMNRFISFEYSGKTPDHTHWQTPGSYHEAKHSCEQHFLYIPLLSFLGNGSLAGGKQFNFNEPGKLETFMLHIPRISTAAALPLYARVRERLHVEQEKGDGFVL